MLKKIEEKEASQPEVKEEAGAAAIILEDDIAEGTTKKIYFFYNYEFFGFSKFPYTTQSLPS